MCDVLFRTYDGVFSLRVAGVCVSDGRVLLQQASNDPGYAFPGGHVALGETGEAALAREFMEEIGAEVSVGPLLWTGELFFPWGERRCHQICLFYQVDIISRDIPRFGRFPATESLEGRSFRLDFVWTPLSELDGLELYPPQAAELLRQNCAPAHFIYNE